MALGGSLTGNTAVDLAGNNLTFSGTGNVGIGGSAAPTQTLDVAGTTRTTNAIITTALTGTGASIGTAVGVGILAAGQSGTATLGAGTAGVNVYTITFPTAFTAAPSQVLVTVRTAAGQTYTDTFSATTKAIGRTSFQVNVQRVDDNALWSQALLLDWIAIP